MKGSRLYILFLIAFLVVVFIMQLLAPHKFIWNPTYDKYDKEPFGSYVFDDILSSSIDDYTVVNKTFYQINQEDSVTNGRAFLLTEASPVFYQTDIENLYRIIHSGNQVMLCTDHFSYCLRDTLGFEPAFARNTVFNLINVNNNKERVSIFLGTDTLKPEQTYQVFSQTLPLRIIPGIQKRESDSTDKQDGEEDEFEETIEEFMEKEDVPEKEEALESENDESKAPASYFIPMKCDSMEILVWDENNLPLAIRAFLGKGELILVTTPLMFTNFGMLDGTNASYVFRLLSFMKGKPLTRIEAYGTHDEKPQTPLRYILSEAPLRWATYTGLLFLLLFMAFTAKRRQRIIPVVKAPQNRTFGFMQLISNLYYQKHENIEMLKMKYMYFCADVKNLIGVELYERVPAEPDYKRLVEKTGMEKDFISMLLQNIRLAIYRGELVDLQLRQYIDGMNELLQALRT